MMRKRINLNRNSSQNVNFNLKRLLYLMAHSEAVSNSSSNDTSWQRSLCYSNKKFDSFPKETLLLYRRMVAVFESHWTKIQTLTIYQGIERNVSFMIPELSSHCEIHIKNSLKPITIYICCGGKDMVALDWLPFISKFFQSHPKETNTTFLLVEYPGYGFNTGKPTPRTCTDVALQTMKRGLEIYQGRNVNVRFLGYSLGTAVLLDSANVIYNYMSAEETNRYTSRLKLKRRSRIIRKISNSRHNSAGKNDLSGLLKIKTTVPHERSNRVRMPFLMVRGRCQPKYRSIKPGEVFVKIRKRLRFHRARVAIKSRKWLGRSRISSVIGQWLNKIDLNHLILIAPFTSTAECVASYLRVPLFLRSISAHLFSFFQNETTKYNNLSVVRQLFETLSKRKKEFKLTVFHGDKDKMVPCYMGQQIVNEATLWPNVHKCTNEDCPPGLLHAKMCLIPGADHTSICSNSEHLNYIFSAMTCHGDSSESFN